MVDSPQADEAKAPDLLALSHAMARLAEHSQRLMSGLMSGSSLTGVADPMGISRVFAEMSSHLFSDPARLGQAHLALWQDYATLWQHTAQRLMGQEAAPVIAPAKDDRRFRDAAWSENALFDFIKQSYLLTARWIRRTVHDIDGLDEPTARKAEFYTRQLVDALSPSNFVLTNPEVLRATIDSGGENLVRGLDNLIKDLERGQGELRIAMTDYDAFQVGRNIAVTPGKVVFQNDLIQLIQYTPTTPDVAKRPLMIVPPWINKFYILDLREKNSFIKWVVDQGHTVFVLSWVNPDERLSAKTFEDYMVEGPLAALDAIEERTGERSVNAIGYCLGGTLLAATLAYMAETGDDRIASATFFTTLLDFTEAGELGVFIDEEQLAYIDDMMREKGYLDGTRMAATFNLLRANDLIWSFVVNNYLLGKEPFPFDLLYWNSDSTRMPAAMHSFYLRTMYQKNLLVKPGAVTLKGVPIDLGRIDRPAYFLSTREDHIAPWTSTYRGFRLMNGERRFTLAGSGHIAGVVNPPAAEKYGFWSSDAAPENSEDWLKIARQTPGSWWPDWQAWVSRFDGGRVPARQPPQDALEDAPGSYVKVRT